MNFLSLTDMVLDWIVIDGDSDLPADKPANGHCVGTTKGICVNLKCDANESDPYY